MTLQLAPFVVAGMQLALYGTITTFMARRSAPQHTVGYINVFNLAATLASTTCKFHNKGHLSMLLRPCYTFTSPACLLHELREMCCCCPVVMVLLLSQFGWELEHLVCHLPFLLLHLACHHPPLTHRFTSAATFRVVLM